MRTYIKIINRCLWCEKQIPFQLNKLLCSIKCLKEIVKSCEEQNGKGTCGYDKSDVILRPKLYKREPIKKQTDNKNA